MIIKGFQRLTLLDFPGKTACTLFTGGCNFRCPFCHNGSLVLPERFFDEFFSEEEIFDFLDKRRGRLGGVCISGGEPTLQADLPTFIEKIKALGYAVKLDTNGYRPDVLRSLCEEGLIDYVAMDIKNSKELYAKTAGLDKFDISLIERSADFLLGGSVPFEFRTTVVRGLHDEKSIEDIGRWLRGGESYFLQGYTESEDIISPVFDGYTKNELNNLLNLLRQYIPNAQIRG